MTLDLIKADGYLFAIDGHRVVAHLPLGESRQLVEFRLLPDITGVKLTKEHTVEAFWAGYKQGQIHSEMEMVVRQLNDFLRLLQPDPVGFEVDWEATERAILTSALVKPATSGMLHGQYVYPQKAGEENGV